MTVNANNAVLNGGYYALSGGKTTVTLTGDTVLTAPETTSGFSAVLGSLPTRPATVTRTCTGNSCSYTVTIGVSIRGVIGFITGKNMAGGAISGASYTATTEAGTVVNGNLVARNRSPASVAPNVSVPARWGSSPICWPRLPRCATGSWRKITTSRHASNAVRASLPVLPHARC